MEGYDTEDEICRFQASKNYPQAPKEVDFSLWGERPDSLGTCKLPVRIVRKQNKNTLVVIAHVYMSESFVHSPIHQGDEVAEEFSISKTSLVGSHTIAPEFKEEEIVEVYWRESPGAYPAWWKATIKWVLEDVVCVQYYYELDEFPSREWVPRKFCRKFIDNGGVP